MSTINEKLLIVYLDEDNNQLSCVYFDSEADMGEWITDHQMGCTLMVKVTGSYLKTEDLS